MFEEVCSIYADALDNVGRYVDMETGECIQQMTIREFCLTDIWKPYVVDLRYLIEVFGSKAKKVTWKQICDEGLAERYQMYYERMVDDVKNHRRREDTDADIEKRIKEGSIYAATKKHLPGATLSGLFDTWDDECTRKDGTKFMAPVSRRETHLQQHTGWLAIDIDLGDNQNLSNFENIRMICRFRPEIALLMRSCSGTGYFGLVKLAYPEEHKAQFKALMKEYATFGITLDKACSNIGRVRFASWDDPEHIYINKGVVPYKGIEKDTPTLPLQTISRPFTYRMSGIYQQRDGVGGRAFWEDQRVQDRLIEVVVKALVDNRINITEDYDDWCKVGWALKRHPYGEHLFHQLSACSGKYNQTITAHKWQQLGQSNTVTYAYLIHAAKQCLREDAYRALCRQVWQELHLVMVK